MYEGLIIKETITDELILDYITIDKVEIWKTNDTIKYWTAISFHSDDELFPNRLADTIIDGWYADMKWGNTKYVVFKDKVLKYEIGNADEKEAVLNYCRQKGVPEQQLDWSE